MAEITQKLGFDAEQAIKTLDRLTGALGGANAALSKMKGAASGAKALDKVEKGTKKATKAADEFLVGWKTIIRVLETQLIVRGLNTLITGLKDAVENARELGLAIEEVRTIDALSRTAEDINKSVLELSSAIGQAPTDLAEGLYQTLSNQVVEAGDSFAFMSEAAKLAKVTASETGDAVNALSSVMNSYNLTASESQHVAGTLFATVEQGRLRLGEIANVIGRVTPLTAQLGITWEETAASIATMTRQGVRADTAITQLRAVVTRLLKPTAEMSAIFRKWGVEDGRQAILTFGGLSGVLKKLAQETGHNSGEMAELLRNVRAIAGVFGIMSNEGNTLAEVLGHVEGATKKATEAWTEYAESDAQKLTVQMQKFDNMMTQIGTKSIPLVSWALNNVNSNLEAFGLGVQFLTGGWTEAEKAAVRYEHAVKKGAEESLELQQAWADASRDAYVVITEASRTYYAEANKLENQLADKRDNAIASATAAFENAADNLTNLYKESLTEIEKFADSAAGNVVKAFERIARLDQDIEKQKLDYRLKQADGYYEKLAVLDKAHQDAIKKREEARLKLTADPESEKRFRKAGEVVIDLAKQKLRLGDQEKVDGKEIYDLTIDVIKAQEKAKQGQERFAKASADAVISVRKFKEEYGDIPPRIKEINERIKEIHEDSIIDPNEKVELKALGAEYDRLKAKMQEGIDLLPAGLDVDFNEVVDGLTEAMNQAHKDWAAEVNLAKAEFAKAVIPIKISLDPGGALAALQKEMDLEQLPGESQAAFAGRTDTAAREALEKENELQGQQNKLRVAGNDSLKETSETLDGLVQKTREEVEAVQEWSDNSRGPLGILSSVEQGLQAERERVATAMELQNALTSILTTLQQEGELNEGAIEAARERNELALADKDITQEQADVYSQLLDQLEELAALNEQIVELQKQMPEKEILALARDILEVKKGLEAASKLEAEQQERIEQAEADRAEKLEGTKKATQALTNETVNTSNAVSDASTGAGNLTSNIADATGGLSLATLQAAVLTQELAKAAAQAAEIKIPSASGGSGAGAYHGGPFYAAGGMFRGQDRQLTALARGETVVNRKQSRRFFSELNAMNQGSQPVYRDQGGPVTNVGDVNVTVQGGDSSQQTVREIAHALRREVKRGNISLR